MTGKTIDIDALLERFAITHPELLTPRIAWGRCVLASCQFAALLRRHSQKASIVAAYYPQSGQLGDRQTAVRVGDGRIIDWTRRGNNPSGQLELDPNAAVPTIHRTIDEFYGAWGHGPLDICACCGAKDHAVLGRCVGPWLGIVGPCICDRLDVLV